MNAFETQPDPEFLAHLEWQVRTEARRESRFAKPAPAIGWRRLRAAAVLVLALGLGAGGVFAAQELQRSREAGLRSAQWKVRCELADARLRMATQERDELRASFEAGAIGAGECAQAERERQQLEHARARLLNEAAEVAQTGREPSDRISAPLVGGRDFVRERLELAASDARAQMQGAEERKALAEERHAAGVTTDTDLSEAGQRCKQALGQQKLLERRLALRAAFLDGRSSALEVELDDLRADAQGAAADQRDELAAAREALVRADALAQAGMISQQELRAAQRRISEAQAALRLSELEIDVLVRPSER